MVGACWVKVVQRTCDEQVSVGIEVFAELVTLVTQVAFDLEFDGLGAVLVGAFGGVAAATVHRRGELAAKFGVHHVVAEVGDVADHACNAQAPTW